MQTLKMDFQSQSAPPVVPVMQSDSQSRFIGITLYDGGVAYEAPKGAQYTVQYCGPGANNMGWYDTIQLSSGTRKAVVVDSDHPNVVTLELAEQALRVNGNVFVNLCVVNNTGYKLNTFPIICRVTGAPYVDPVSVRSYFYVTGLTSEQWLAYVTACQDAQNRAEAAAATFQTDPTLSLSGKAADAAKVGEAVNAEATRAKAAEEENAKRVSQLKEDLMQQIGGTVYGDNLFTLNNIVAGKYISTTGNDGASIDFNGSSKYAYLEIEVNPNEQYLVKTYVIKSGQKVGVVVFAREDGRALSGGIILPTDGEPMDLLTSGVVVTAPSNAVKMYVSAYNVSAWSVVPDGFSVQKISSPKGKVYEEIDKKLDNNQGAENYKKFLKVGADGNIVTGDIDVIESIQKSIDPTLSLSGKAADAKATGDAIGELKEDISNKLGITSIGNNLFVPESVVKSEYVSSSGNSGASIGYSTSSKYARISVSVVAGERYRIATLVVGQIGSFMGVVVFEGSNGKAISGGISLNKTTETYSSIEAPVTLTVPSNAIKMHISAYNNSGWANAFNDDIRVVRITTSKGSIDERIDSIDEDILNLQSDKLNIAQGAENSGKYMRINENGNVVPAELSVQSSEFDCIPGLQMSTEYLYSQAYAKDYFRRYVYSLFFEKQMQSSVVVADANDLAAHDSNMVIVDGIAYIVYCGALVKGTVDNAGGNNAFVRLIKWNVDNSAQLSSEVFAKHGDSIGGYTVTRGCGQPNITKVSDDTLRVTFSAYINYNSLEICCICYKDYTMSTGTTTNSGVCTLDGKPINLYYVAQNYDCMAIGYENYYAEGRRLSQMQMNATIAYSNGYYYACPLSGSLMTAIILKSVDLITWEYVSMIPYKFATAYEGACCVDGDYLYVAFRLNNSGTVVTSSGQINTYDAFGLTGLSMNGYTNGMPVYKYSLSSNKFIDVTVMPDASCRPEFFTKDNNIYLIHGGWSGRSSGYISQINKQKLNLTSIIRETRNAGNYQYLSVAEYNGKTYCCMSKNKIEFAQFNVDNYINVEEKFMALLGL